MPEAPVVSEPVVIGAGPQPSPVYDTDTRRECIGHARVLKRVEVTEWSLAEAFADGVTVQWWDAQVVVLQPWSRVFPTPRSCVLRHRQWVRNHGGHRG